MFRMLDVIYNANPQTLEIESLYHLPPFDRSREAQYPGHVISYVLMQISDIDTTKEHDGYSKQEWLDYKKNIFNKICAFISDTHIDSFTAKDCATVIHRITKMLTSDLRSSNLPTGLNLLLLRLHTQREEADTQQLANALWALSIICTRTATNLNHAQEKWLYHFKNPSRL